MTEIKKFFDSIYVLETLFLTILLLNVGQSFLLWGANYAFFSNNDFTGISNFFEDFLLRYLLILFSTLVLVLFTTLKQKAIFTFLGIVSLVVIIVQIVVIISEKYSIPNYSFWKYGFVLGVSFYLDIVLLLAILLTSVFFCIFKFKESTVVKMS